MDWKNRYKKRVEKKIERKNKRKEVGEVEWEFKETKEKKKVKAIE